MSAITKVINQAAHWIGYLEKKSNYDLDDFVANAGYNNYTCFARDYKTNTGHNFQAQPWCAMFVSEIFVQVFGLEKAKDLLGGELYHYCPTGVNQFEKKGRFYQNPEVGDVIFFHNGTRAYHTGIVSEITNTHVKTIEGNTSGASGVVENGGGVCTKSYLLSEGKIQGYGRPDYSTVDEKLGWNKDEHGWWYRDEDGGYPANEWRVIDHHWYLFNQEGYICTDWHRWDGANCDAEYGSWYFLDNTKDGPLEGACWHSRENGAMEPWYIE